MIKTVEQLLSGRYEYTRIPPSLSEESVRLTIEPGKDGRGSILVKSGDGQRLRGFGHVTCARIVLAHERYTGTALKIDYGVDAGGLRNGDTVDGEIILSLNTGEIEIPVHADILDQDRMTSMGRIRNLDEFAQLAKVDPPEALRVFSSGSLAGCIPEQDQETATLLRTLTANPVTYQRMEEFLVATGKKEAVVLTANKNSEIFEHLTESTQGIIRIAKNTWGNVNLQVSAKGSFIKIPQKHFVEDDFVGNALSLPYIISYEDLGEGLNKGMLLISSDGGDITVHITATRHSVERDEEKKRIKRAAAGICHDLMEFMLGRTDGTTLVKRCVPRIGVIRRNVEEGIGPDLLEAYTYYLAGAKEASAGLLKKWREHDFGEEAASYEAAYLFLSAKTGLRYTEDETLRDEMAALFSEDEESLIILLLLAETDPALRERPGRILSYMSRMYRAGNNSPFLFLKASMLLRGRAALLTNLSPFAKALLLFALRYGLCDQDTALRAALLAANEKTFTPAVYHILSASYKLYPMDEILEALCRLILKGNPRRAEYHIWYALAISKDIRITRLYEYYMETLPERYRKPLPLKVRRYFTMNNTLGAGRRALLFANIVWNRSFDPETYEEYVPVMQAFAEESLLRENMNEDFAILYSEFIRSLPSQELAEAMSSVMFRHVIYCDDPRVREVVVTHAALRKEEVYPLYHGRAYADIYTDDAIVVFQDERGRRFRSGLGYSIQRLIDTGTYAETCRRLGVLETPLALHFASRGPVEENEEYLPEFMYISTCPEFTEEYRKKTGAELLSYFASHRDSDSLDLYLTKISPEKAAEGAHLLLIEIMSMRGMNREAYALAIRYGYEGLEPNLFGRLVSKIITLKDEAFDEELVLAADWVRRAGTADERVLQYLCRYYEGRLSDMTEVRKRCAHRGIDTSGLDEKILRYSMFTGTRVPEGPMILSAYAKAGGSPKICDAYLNFEALRSFADNTALDMLIASRIARGVDSKEKTDAVCLLALLKYYTEKAPLTEEETGRRDRLFAQMVREGYLFSFYARIPVDLRQLYHLDDKLILEYRGLPQDKATAVYTLSSEPDKGVRTIPMRRMISGIFACPVTAFAGEVVRYTVNVRRGGTEYTSEEQLQVMPLQDKYGRSRYQRINRMSAELAQGDIQNFNVTLKKYRLALATVEKLFPGNDDSAAGKERTE